MGELKEGLEPGEHIMLSKARTLLGMSTRFTCTGAPMYVKIQRTRVAAQSIQRLASPCTLLLQTALSPPLNLRLDSSLAAQDSRVRPLLCAGFRPTPPAS